jgi:hypothetical protein
MINRQSLDFAVSDVHKPTQIDGFVRMRLIVVEFSECTTADDILVEHHDHDKRALNSYGHILDIIGEWLSIFFHLQVNDEIPTTSVGPIGTPWLASQPRPAWLCSGDATIALF